jgi:S-adenosylmethionine:tRNA-ribosyltransferase-isomerase (queuine synthetase)
VIAADQPVQRPPRAKLLVIDGAGRMQHMPRASFVDLLAPGDLVIANDAATLPASLSGVHEPTGAQVEVRLAGLPSHPPARDDHSDPARQTGPRASNQESRDRRPARSQPAPPREGRNQQAPALAGIAIGSPSTTDGPVGPVGPVDPVASGGSFATRGLFAPACVFAAVVFGGGDYRIRTEERPLPPALRPGDRLILGPLTARVERLLGHPRLVALRFAGAPDAIWAGLARHGRPIQYAHVPAPLALWDVWTAVAGHPVAFEPPSAGFLLDWQTLGALRGRGVAFATLTHAAGISSTGDPKLDSRLPFDEPYFIPADTAEKIRAVRRRQDRDRPDRDRLALNRSAGGGPACAGNLDRDPGLATTFIPTGGFPTDGAPGSNTAGDRGNISNAGAMRGLGGHGDSGGIGDTGSRAGRIVAIGTTVVRALEHAAALGGGLVRAGVGVADQRIGPGTRLRVVDAMVSGTHEPGSSHYQLLRAFAGAAILHRADRELAAHGYRTHEFGDSVWIERQTPRPGGGRGPRRGRRDQNALLSSPPHSVPAVP